MIEFRLDPASGVTTYWQIVQQVRQAVRVGRLKPGDQLPTAREVVAKLAINPNTVLKAYRELERDGFVTSRPGAGTFIAQHAPAPLERSVGAPLRRSIDRWIEHAMAAGLDRETVIALFTLAIEAGYRREAPHGRRS